MLITHTSGVDSSNRVEILVKISGSEPAWVLSEGVEHTGDCPLSCP